MMEDTTSPSSALALADVKAEVSKQTTKASDEVFLLTLLEGAKVVISHLIPNDWTIHYIN
jgi:hypothetical protein